MSLRWVELSRERSGVVCVNGRGDFGDLPPVLPGAFAWSVLKALTGLRHRMLVAVAASPADDAHYEGRGLRSAAAVRQAGWFGRRILLGELCDAVAPDWFARTEALRGFIVSEGRFDELAAQLALRDRERDLLSVVAVQFESWATTTLMLRSACVPSADLLEVAARIGRDLRLPRLNAVPRPRREAPDRHPFPPTVVRPSERGYERARTMMESARMSPER